ncbi:MAG: alkaline phosphatase D family protein [Robiginitomaculum sp.]|nr:alkaline phosphatase D family protein [Robiginitomaculum sp.]MDQ7078770.1 alkaline phosphatase D family protein [Robiginitomaculum sp.]
MSEAIVQKENNPKSDVGKITRRSALALTGVGGALAACGQQKPTARKDGTTQGIFRHGIASGDPLQTRVILWTAIAADGLPATITAEVSTDAGFANIVWSGLVKVRPQLAVNGIVPLKIEAVGLNPGTDYFYRFREKGGEVSPLGRTKTLSDGPMDELTMALVSCSNHPAGYFHAYRHIAQSDPVDVVVHLGDYIYEYGPGGFATQDAEALGRVPEPPHECVNLDDYRRRYAQYHRDPDLQAAHAAAPWIITWDDHESANDSWKGGAQNHQREDGDWATREAASLSAFYEWTPTREPSEGQPRSAFWREFVFGDLATLTMLETRLTARSEQVDWKLFPVPADADPEDPVVKAKVASFVHDLVGDPNRRMLGDQQGNFVEASFKRSVEAGQPWQLLGNQVLLAKINSPNYIDVLPGWLKWLAKKKQPLLFEYFLRSRFRPPLNIDAWDGYPAARERLYNRARRAGASFISLAGDTHDFNASRLRAADGQVVGAELGTTGVSSPGNFADVVAPGVDFGRLTEAANPDTILHDVHHTGYIRLTLRPDEAVADYVSTSSVKQPNFTTKIHDRFRLKPAQKGEAVTLEKI